MRPRSEARSLTTRSCSGGVASARASERLDGSTVERLGEIREVLVRLQLEACGECAPGLHVVQLRLRPSRAGEEPVRGRSRLPSSPRCVGRSRSRRDAWPWTRRERVRVPSAQLQVIFAVECPREYIHSADNRAPPRGASLASLVDRSRAGARAGIVGCNPAHGGCDSLPALPTLEARRNGARELERHRGCLIGV